MTLFVGGSLHAHDVHVPDQVQSAEQIAAGEPPRPSPIYLDMATGIKYIRRDAFLNLTDPSHGNRIEARWTAPVYACEDVTDDVFMPAVNSAVLTWWFKSTGHQMEGAVQLAPNPVMANGHAPVRFMAGCPQCGIEPTEFVTPGERAKWLVGHNEKQDHQALWKDETREGVSHGSGEDSGNVQEG